MSTVVASTTAVPVQPTSPNGRAADADAAQTPAAPISGTAQTSGNADPAGASAASTPKAPPPASPVGFTLHFDPDTQRFVLEARDPNSGVVLYQIPPQYAVKQLSASASATPPRGGTVDSAV